MKYMQDQEAEKKKAAADKAAAAEEAKNPEPAAPV